jgi:hypothetical protein
LHEGKVENVGLMVANHDQRPGLTLPTGLISDAAIRASFSGGVD